MLEERKKKPSIFFLPFFSTSSPKNLENW